MDIDKLRNIAATLAISYDPAISDEDIATISDAAVEIERLRAELKLKTNLIGWLVTQRPDGSIWISFGEQAVLAARTYFEKMAALRGKEG